jgi:type II secretory pathway pseudopilin PulG
MNLKTFKPKHNRTLYSGLQISGDRGITALELLIAVTILVILASVIISAFSNFRKNSDLNGSAESAVSVLAEARSKTLSSQSGSQYGVHFEISKMVLFKGADYAASPEKKEIFLPVNIEISDISVGGGNEVIFKRLTGDTDQPGTITFRLKSDPEKTRVINILLTGSINL